MNPSRRSFYPGRKKGKERCVALFLFILGRTLQSLSRIDPATRNEVGQWEEGFSIMFRVFPDSPKMSLQKKDGVLRYLGSKGEDADLSINFKNVDSALMTLTPQKSIFQAFAEHRCIVMGDLTVAMSLMRCLNSALIHLYPRIISKRLVKRPPPRSFNMPLIRLRLFLVGIPLGK